jgi:membrane protein YqaA with SNARE-associated domain
MLQSVFLTQKPLTRIMPIDALIAGISWLIVSMNSLFQFLAGWGYFGAFIISLIGSATIILPLPAFAFIFLFAGELNPILLAFVSAIGAAIGELTGYALGYGGSKIAQKKNNRWKKDLDRTEQAFKKYGGFWIIILFAATPLPDDIVGIVAGALKYSTRKFLIATFIGKLIISLIAAYAGMYSMHWVMSILGAG